MEPFPLKKTEYYKFILNTLVFIANIYLDARNIERGGITQKRAKKDRER